jgi:hypothetical protein
MPFGEERRHNLHTRSALSMMVRGTSAIEQSGINDSKEWSQLNIWDLKDHIAHGSI